MRPPRRLDDVRRARDVAEALAGGADLRLAEALAAEPLRRRVARALEGAGLCDVDALAGWVVAYHAHRGGLDADGVRLAFESAGRGAPTEATVGVVIGTLVLPSVVSTGLLLDRSGLTPGEGGDVPRVKGSGVHQKQRTIRLPVALWARVDAWMETGAALNHSEALRQLLSLALDAEERRTRRAAASKRESAAAPSSDAEARRGNFPVIPSAPAAPRGES